MRIVGLYSFNNGLEFVQQRFPDELGELERAIENVDATAYKTKVSREKTMPGKILYSLADLNKAFKAELGPLGWKNIKEKCDYSDAHYVAGYENRLQKKALPFRDMDFVKNQLGIEFQFGKYSFMVYNVCAKMTIFKKLGHIIAGVEVVPVKELAEQMSTGVSYFVQFVWDLEQRGVSNIDIPVMIIGIAP
jgi:Restriction endonuclease BglII